MLTADLVRVRRRNNQLHLLKFSAKTRDVALELASQYMCIARASIGLPRAAFQDRCAQIAVSPRDRKLAAGLLKIISDRIEFEISTNLDPAALRRATFLRASRERSRARPINGFSRDAVLSEIAQSFNARRDVIDRALYADLRGEHVLRSFSEIDPKLLVESYRVGQTQAILLRALRMTVTLHCDDSQVIRRLFGRLKFLRLLFSIEARGCGEYQLVIDGPFALFSSATKYGLQLALAVPIIRECRVWAIDAEVVWGKSREVLLFHTSSEMDARELAATKLRSEPISYRAPSYLDSFIDRFRSRQTTWKVSPAEAILALSGVDLCVPDLCFEREDGVTVYLEMMGYWSRQAVWRRVDLIEAGLPYRIIFALSERLRVSEEALGVEAPAALYVYKGVPNVQAVARKLDKIARRSVRVG